MSLQPRFPYSAYPIVLCFSFVQIRCGSAFRAFSVLAVARCIACPLLVLCLFSLAVCFARALYVVDAAGQWSQSVALPAQHTRAWILGYTFGLPAGCCACTLYVSPWLAVLPMPASVLRRLHLCSGTSARTVTSSGHPACRLLLPCFNCSASACSSAPSALLWLGTSAHTATSGGQPGCQLCALPHSVFALCIFAVRSRSLLCPHALSQSVLSVVAV